MILLSQLRAGLTLAFDRMRLMLCSRCWQGTSHLHLSTVLLAWGPFGLISAGRSANLMCVRLDRAAVHGGFFREEKLAIQTALIYTVSIVLLAILAWSYTCLLSCGRVI